MFRWASILLLFPALFAQEVQEQALGLILDAKEGRLRRAGTELPLTVRNGDLLFSDASLLVETGSVRFLFCPEKVEVTVQAPADLTVRENALKIRSNSQVMKRSVP